MAACHRGTALLMLSPLVCCPPSVLPPQVSCKGELGLLCTNLLFKLGLARISTEQAGHPTG